MGIPGVEKTLTSHVAFQGKFITLRVHEVLLPNGKKTVREIVEHPGACACVVLNDQNEVLLVEQYRKAAEAVLLEIPAGKIDSGEPPESCIRREVKEETGISITDPVFLSQFYPTPGFTNEKMYVYLARSLKQEHDRPMEDECIGSRFLPFREALTCVKTGKIQDSKSIIGLLLANERFLKSDVPCGFV